MKLPKEYIVIKDYLESYMNMQEISAALTGKDLDRKYKTHLMENDNYWIAILIDAKKPQNSKWGSVKVSGDLEKYTYTFYLDKNYKKVCIKATIKSTHNTNANNFMMDSLFKKFKTEGINNIELIQNETFEISWNVRCAFLKVNINMEGDYMIDINKTLDLIDKYNKIVFDKLSDKWARRDSSLKI